jgi:hypothetical protein
MSQLGSDLQIAPAALFTSTSTSQSTLGARAATADGRSVRYVKMGAVAAVPGKLYQAPAEVTNHQDLAPAAAAIGATQVTVTLGATAATANQYQGGFLVVTVTPGQGYMYRISSNPAADASATMVVTLEDPLLVALTTSSRVDLLASPYNGVIVNPATASSAPVGVAVYAIPAGEYGFLQTGGPAAVLADGGITVGVNVSASNATAGAVEAAVTAQAAIGQALTGIATTEYGSVFLTMK